MQKRFALLLVALLLSAHCRAVKDGYAYLDLADTCNTDLVLGKQYCDSALVIAMEQEDKILEFEANMTLSSIYSKLDSWDASIEVSMELLRISKEIPEKEYQVKALIRLGMTYGYAGELDKALENYAEAHALASVINNLEGLMIASGNRGDIYRIQGKFEQAIQSLEESRRYMVQDSVAQLEKGNLAALTLNFADYYLKIEDLAAAEEQLNLSRSYLASIADPDYRTEMEICQREYTAKFYVESGEFEQALLCLDTLEGTLRDRKGMGFRRTQYHGLRARAYRYLYRYEEALDEAAKLISLLYDLRANDINEIERRNVQKLQILQANSLLKTETENLSLSIANQRLWIILLVTVAFLLCILIVIFAQWIKKNKLRQKALWEEKNRIQEEVEEKNRRLANNVLQLKDRSTFIGNISEILKVNKDTFSGEALKVVNSIHQKINLYKGSNFWEEFERSFMDVHADFYDNLYEDHPNLTTGEKRLAAFIKLNLSVEDVSKITGKRANTIWVSRTRLRAKLGLTNTETKLAEYIGKY